MPTKQKAKQTVVCIDDDSNVREGIENLAESAGYTVLLFASAEDFVASGALARADCLITDVRMPGMDGLELQRFVRLKSPNVPIIFITAHHDDQVRRRALDGGAVEFLYKPFDPDALLCAMHQVLRQSLNESC